MWLGSNTDPVKSLVCVKKGMNNLTEMYSAIAAEVPIPSDPSTMTHHHVIDHLKIFEKVIICGQALSHCVNYTTRDVLKHWVATFIR